MNRLTSHDSGLKPYVVYANERIWREIYNKLMIYEDLDVEPEEIGSLLLWCEENSLGNLVGLLNAIAIGNVHVMRHGEWLPVDDLEDTFDCSECDAMVAKRLP